MSGTAGSASATAVDQNPCNALADSPAGLLGGSQYAVAALYRNGAIIDGSEVMIVGVGGGSNSAQATGSASVTVQLAAGDSIDLYAYRLGQSTAAILSNLDGRTNVTLRWLGPDGDIAS